MDAVFYWMIGGSIFVFCEWLFFSLVSRSMQLRVPDGNFSVHDWGLLTLETDADHHVFIGCVVTLCIGVIGLIL